MAYYIISFVPDELQDFQKRIPFLSDAVWVKERKQIEEVILSPEGDAFFFVQLSQDRELIDEMVLILREKLTFAKILYITSEETAHILKSHQLTPAGGDAYIPLNIDPTSLLSILEGLSPPAVNPSGNRLDQDFGRSVTIGAEKTLEDFKNHPSSKLLDKIFLEAIPQEAKKPLWQSSSMLKADPVPDELEPPEDFSLEDIPDKIPDEENEQDEEEFKLEENEEDTDAGDDMSDKDQELSLDDLGDLELGGDDEIETPPADEGGLDLDLSGGEELDLSSGDEISDSPVEEDGLDLDLSEGFSLDDSLTEEDNASAPDDDSLDFTLDDPDESPALELSEESDDVGLDMGGDDDGAGLSLSDDVSLDDGLSFEDDLSLDEGLSLDSDDDSPAVDLSDDALEKLKEIDAIMDDDASQVGITLEGSSLSLDSGKEDDLGGMDMGLDLGVQEEPEDSNIDTSLVSDDLDLGSISFSNDEDEEEAPVKEEKNKKKPSNKEARESYDGNIGKDLKEISGAYSGEMERMQATLSNLRSDREELLARIQKLEEDKVLQNRQTLTMRAELDEKKIELSIIRKKLNDEISELKDRLKLFEEKKLILEEKNRILAAELDKAGQKNKIDVKKVQMRERDLEQKLELLKADSETQIRHRDLKILELKRKLDAMEFDIESISVQEKRSVESRFELEDKLDKAIKTLRNAITVLEDESDRSGVLDALKKNIDM